MKTFKRTHAGSARSRLSDSRKRHLGTAAGFARDEEGSLIIFGLFIFVLMLLGCGMGLDLMRLETARVKLQTTVDRAALAAANLNQELPPEQVVADYFDKAGLAEFLTGVTVTESAGLRNVAVDTSLDMSTHFMGLAGVETLPARAYGAAEESIGDVEISMVLDVSGSMNRYNRLVNLKKAAGEFVDTVYSTPTSGYVTTSVIPYSTQVNAGASLLAQYNLGTDTHDDSHCVNFEDGDFDESGLSTTDELEQTQHFDPWYNSADLRLPVCRAEAGVDILAWSIDPVEIKSRINAFQAGGNTSTDVGVKWGNALLDPGSQGVVNELVNLGEVDTRLRGHPLPIGDSMKVLVVMSDGVHTQQYYVKPDYRGNKPSNVWAHYTGGGNPEVSIWSGNGPAPDPGNDWVLAANEFYYPSTDSWGNQPIGAAAADRMTYQELWAEFPVKYHAYQHIEPMAGAAARNEVLNRVAYVQPSIKNDRLLRACSVAKAQNAVVYTIGLEVTSASGALLEACATSPNHYFLVDGQDLSYAFKSIAGAINLLRLTQ